MPSIRAYATSWVVWAMFYRRKRSTEERLLLDVQRDWKSEYAREVVPKNIQVASDIRVDEEHHRTEGQGAQTWKVFHCTPTAEVGTVSDKTIVYWHGGAFINAAADQHWWVIHRLVRDHNVPVIFPQYTRAPEGTAADWCYNAIKFLLSIAQDPRYKGKKVVHMGDSAGGWMSLRVRLLLYGLILGEEKVSGIDGEDVEGLKGLANSLGASILISPAVNFEVTDKLREAEKTDPWLSISLTTAIRRLWFRGPSAVPEIDFQLPRNQTSLTIQADLNESDTIYADPKYSINNGLDVIKRYLEKYPQEAPIQVLTMQGTYDICIVGVKPMQERLEKLGEKLVKAEYIEEKGLMHVYPILDMPETDKAWKRIGAVLLE